MSTPEGWYPDPEQPDALRWWDGSQWAASQANGGPVPDVSGATAATDSAAPASDAYGAAPSTDDHSRFTGQANDSTSDSAVVSTDSADASQLQAGAFTAPTPSWEQPATVEAPQPAWGATDTNAQPAWGSPDTNAQPAWGATDTNAQPAWGSPQQPTQSAWGADPNAQQYGGGQLAPTGNKPKTGLIIGLIAGGVALIALIIVGVIVIAGIVGGGGNAEPNEAGAFPLSERVAVPEDGQQVVEFTVTEPGTYRISAVSSNYDDGVIEVSGPAGSFNDDDSGDDFNPLLEVPLTPGTYTVTVTGYGGGDWTGTVTVEQL